MINKKDRTSSINTLFFAYYFGKNTEYNVYFESMKQYLNFYLKLFLNNTMHIIDNI
jgi:hypothetical protein